MSEPTPKKRARNEIEEDSGTRDASPSMEAGSAARASDSPRKKDEEFWFEDGNVILVARDVEFRVYRGILADHSPVFKTMFSLPQPPSDERLGCPEVELTDSPEDLRHVLRVYMPKSDFNPFMPEKPYFDMISATIRLGHKYEMHELVDHSVAYLKSYYPSDFDIWEKLDHYVPPHWEFSHSIGVVNLARLTGELSLLPTALSICCMLESDILEGLIRADGTREHLSHGDLRRCLDAQKKLVAHHVTAFVSIFKLPTQEDCRTAAACRRERRRMLENVDQCILGWNGSIIDSSLHSCIGEDVKGALCEKCWGVIKRREVETRRIHWEFLPDIFNLTVPGWDGHS